MTADRDNIKMRTTGSNRSETTDVVRAVGVFHLKSGLFVAVIALTTWWGIQPGRSYIPFENEYGILVFVGAQVCTYYLLASYRDIIHADAKLKAVLGVFWDKWPLIVILTGIASVLIYQIGLAIVLSAIMGGSIQFSSFVPAVPIGFLAGGALWPYLTGCSLRVWILRPEGQYLSRLGRIFTVVTVSLTCTILSILGLVLVTAVIGSMSSLGPAFPLEVGVPTGVACLYLVYERYPLT